MQIRNAAFAAAVLLTACAASPATLSQAMNACDRGASHAEVQGAGTVVRVLGMRDSRSGEHEGFVIRMSGRSIKVETNTDITGPVPLQRGDLVRLQGQYECDDSVIHWTHHDPRGRHIGGYIEVHGNRYQ